jgi:AcrR family transcriptional regulator
MNEAAAHLAGAELRGSSHICAFFGNRAEADRELIPFAREGLDHHERVVRIVAATRRDSYLATLHEAGVDVDGARASGALLVETWEDTYVRGGRFDRAAMLALILGILAEGRSIEFPRTRYIADMEWALQAPTPIQEVIEYEARVDRALRKLPDLVVCSYHSRHFGAPVVVDMLAVHPLALVGGTLRSTRGEHVRASARERILKATDHLFHAQGIHATSVDAIIAEADVAKATLYRHFPTKDDLILAWLKDPWPRWFDRARSLAETRTVDPGAIPAILFDTIAEWLTADDFRGSPYLSAAVEIVDPAHPARAVIAEYSADMETELRSILERAGFTDPGDLAAELLVLISGAISLAVARRTIEPVTIARTAALRLLAPPVDPG